MGTRHALVFFYQGRLVLSQEGSYDGAPSVVGRAILTFIAEPEKVKHLTKGLSNIRQAPQEEVAQAERWKSDRL